MAAGDREEPTTSYRVCSLAVGAWISKPFDPAQLKRGVDLVEEPVPADILAEMVAAGDWPKDTPCFLQISHDTTSNDRARAAPAQAKFSSVLALFCYLKANGLELVGEYAGVAY